MSREQQMFDEKAAAALGVTVETLQRMRAQHHRFMEQFDTAQYLEDPRAWGTVDYAIEKTLERKRHERMNRR
jgi:hypothetical protein